MPADRDVIEILVTDHREVERMFIELESLRGSADDASRGRRQALAEQVVIELVRHSVAEESDVYPVLAEKVSSAQAERARHEHAEAEQTMKRLEKLDPTNPAFEQQLSELISEVRAHVAEEEGQVFPQLRQALSADELLELGRKVQRTKSVAPTRPHPAAPDRPPADKLLGPATGLLDRMRDAISRRGAKS